MSFAAKFEYNECKKLISQAISIVEDISNRTKDWVGKAREAEKDTVGHQWLSDLIDFGDNSITMCAQTVTNLEDLDGGLAHWDRQMNELEETSLDLGDL